MKKLQLQNLGLYTLLTMMVWGAFSCAKPEDLLKGTFVNVQTDLLLNPVTVQVLTHDGGEVPRDIKVTAYGTDKDEIFTVLGERELTPSYNDSDKNAAFLSLAVRRITEFDEDNPLEFTLKFEAEGYIPVFRSYRITNPDRTMHDIRMTPVGAHVEGLNTESVTIAQDDNGTLEVFKAQTPASRNGQRVSIEVAPNTRMKDNSGNVIGGDIDAHIVSYDYSSSNTHKIAPVSLFTNNGRSKDGGELGFSNFVPLAVYSIDMYAADKEVKHFDKPIKVQVEIPTGTPHPETGEPIQVGDELEAWSFNESIGEWQEEGMATIISENSGHLIAQYEQPHLSTWFFGGRIRCNPPTRFLIENSNQPQNGPQTFYYVEVVQINNGNVRGTFFTRFFDGQIITMLVPIQFQNVGPIVRFDIYAFEGDPTPLYTSPPFRPCGDMLTINLDDVLVTPPSLGTTFIVDVAGTCSANYSNLVVQPTLPILFRRAGNPDWSPLGWLDAGEGTTTALEKGEFYDFRISYRTLERCVFNLQVPTTDSTVIVESTVYNYGPGMPFSETIDVDYVDTDNDGIEETVYFNYTDIEVPDQACQEYIDFLNSPFN